MKPIFMAMTAMGALAAAAPAASQSNQYQTYPYQNGQYQNGQYQNGYYQSGQAQATTSTAQRIDNRITMLQTRLNAGVRDGAINWREAEPLHQQLYQLSTLERRYSADGLTVPERDELRERIRSLRQQIRTADGGSYDRHEHVDQYGNYLDPNAGSYGNGAYGQGGYGQGGPYEPVAAPPQQQQGVLGSIVSSIFGVGGLQVGQAAPGSLYGVPSQYQNQYRDGNGVYYRSDGRQIYGIDARTGTVVRAYPMN